MYMHIYIYIMFGYRKVVISLFGYNFNVIEFGNNATILFLVEDYTSKTEIIKYLFCRHK